MKNFNVIFDSILNGVYWILFGFSIMICLLCAFHPDIINNFTYDMFGTALHCNGAVFVMGISSAFGMFSLIVLILDIIANCSKDIEED